MSFQGARQYGINDGTTTSIGAQLIPFYYQRKALIDLKKEQYFGQLADTESMPKHFGRTIKRYHYIPLLDDRNINDQGIDATTASYKATVAMTDTNDHTIYAVAKGDTAAVAEAAAKTKAYNMLIELAAVTSSGTITDYASAKAALMTEDDDGNAWTFVEHAAVNTGGNMYGSSRDVGTINGQLPVIDEHGGRKNRVGFTRIPIQATITNFGFFHEYTEDSVQFDNDPELMEHVSRETLRAANQIVEDCIQMDLLNASNVVKYGGAATTPGDLTGNKGSTPCVLTYDLLTRMETSLNNNHCPRDTTIIKGSRMTDTRTIGSARYVYIGPEVKISVLKMQDYHQEKAFIPVQQYADAGNIASGEIGAVGNFRFIENPQMMYWEGKGASEGEEAGGSNSTDTSNQGYRATGGKYDVFPVLIVGSKSFTTIGFQTSGKDTKYRIYNRKPGEGPVTRDDPYHKTGLYSIQWWYGTMVQRPEWIGLIKVVAPK